jgi:hypothetical protein
MILAFAATSKLAALVEAREVWRADLVLVLALVLFEFLVACALLLFPTSYHIRAATAVMFLLFLLYSLRIIFTGGRACGCFGTASPPPQWMALIDVIVLGLLLAGTRIGHGLMRLHTVAVPSWRRNSTAMILIAVVTGMITPVLRRQSTNGRASPLTVASLRDMIGQPLSILDEIEADVELRLGRWKLILYEPSCDDCLRELKTLLSAELPLDAPAVLVSLTVADFPDFISHFDFRRAHLVSGRYVEPTVMTIDDGVLVAVEPLRRGSPSFLNQ